jgi:hypothetical protein
MQEELQCTMLEETSCNTYYKDESKNQVSNFLHCFLKMLSDPKGANELTHMITRCIGEEKNHYSYFFHVV